MGRQHAVLVTRGGELFTWGSGQGGKLGLGHMMDARSPQRVNTLWGQSIKHVAAGGDFTSPQGYNTLYHIHTASNVWIGQSTGAQVPLTLRLSGLNSAKIGSDGPVTADSKDVGALPAHPMQLAAT